MEFNVRTTIRPRRILLLCAVVAAAFALPAVAVAQAPATNASGGQYLPAAPGGGGNLEEGDLLRKGNGVPGGSGFKAVGRGADSADSTRISVVLPLLLLISLAAVTAIAASDRVRSRRTAASRGS